MNKLIAMVAATVLVAGIGGCSSEPEQKARTDLPPVSTTLDGPYVGPDDGCVRPPAPGTHCAR
jgi:hypothetical protein